MQEAYSFFADNNKILHGGAELQMFLLAKHLSKFADNEIIFMVGNYGQPKSQKIENINVVRTVNIYLKKSFFFKAITALKMLYLIIKHKPDVVITTTFNPTSFVFYIYKTLFKKKHIHRTASLIEVNKQWINENAIMGKLFEISLLNADVVITQNYEHKDLLETSHKLKNIHVLKNVIEIKNHKISFSQKKNLLWVSRYVEMKNPFMFLILAKQIPDYNFIMICPNSQKDIQRWTQLKEEATKMKNVTFIDKVEHKYIQKYFDDALIFINTSDYEGFPNTFLQAAIAETPIVSLVVNPDNFLNTYNCGYACENKFDILLTKTLFLLNNNELREKMGENCFSYVSQNHDINTVGDNWKQLINNL